MKLIFNDEILAEYYEVLTRPKFHFLKEAVDVAVNKIKEISLNIEAASVVGNMPDPKDVIFYVVTMNARNEKDVYLVTGNIKHFPENHLLLHCAKY